jgi:hypothetical protein
VPVAKQQGPVKIGDRHQIGAVKAAKKTGVLLRKLEPVDGELLIWACLGFRDLVTMLCHA